MVRFALVIPTLNAGQDLDALLESLQRQTRQPDRFLVIDSSSEDETVPRLRAAGADIEVISRAEFNHGGTRMKGARMAAEDCEVVLFLTQDVILHTDDALERLLKVFSDPAVGSAYGRQIPHEGAAAIERFSRFFSYGGKSARFTRADIPRIGFRTAFCSNAFSAFRLAALTEVGGFPERTIFGEDALAVAELILAGHTHCYVADAVVRHSHSYTLGQEFRRYFDIGVMHAQNRKLIEDFGSPSGAGKNFVLGELRYLAGVAPWRVPEAILRTVLKYTAYKLGRREEKISLSWKKRLSMHKRYWPAG
ncbi:glycosyltransferase [Roseovarius sp.]|jgi:rhamnosyltransferase|uniref:glycosyltransferase family 2 protein n=1 Tax=Roseovarius sp. TaxID=1486281 RepID=UPI000C3A74A8|nr:glycosyltransferase [Roseovarius sp.]MAZ20495.1 rhamnosyltransferase [Roseovarius sp.]